MSLPTILAVALALAMDALAVAVAAGLVIAPLTGRHVFRLSFHFGLFQFMMPVIGWAVGSTVAQHVSAYDHWVAFALLAFIGSKMLWEAGGERALRPRLDPTRGMSLVTLSVATSIDALAVGLSAAFVDCSVWLPAVVIGVVAAALTAGGITVGRRLGSRFSRWANVGGGVVLIGIGVKVVVEHLRA